MRVLLAILALLFAAAPAAAQETPRTFAFAIGTGALQRDLSGYDLVVVDGEEATSRQIAAIPGTTLGYLSVGTIERGRPWFAAAKPYRGAFWDDWGEWYADVRAPGYRRLILRVAARMERKGFDGLFLDNVDMIETHRGQARAMRRLVHRLAELVHARGDLLFAQNGDNVVDSLAGDLDGWNREDVSFTYDFDRRAYVPVPAADHRAALRTIARLRDRGLIVTATDYVAAGDTAGAQAAHHAACAVGALSFVSDIELTRLPTPAACG